MESSDSPRGTPAWICRSVELGDAAAVARVHVSAWRAAYAEHMPADYLASLDPDAFRSRWEQGIQAGRTSSLIERDGQVAGFAMYGGSRDADALPSTGELFAINLDPSYWRMGLGRALLAVTVSRLREAGFIDATLWVLHGNDRARRFYEALGWSADGAEKRDPITPSVIVHEVRYRRALDDGDGTRLDAVPRRNAAEHDASQPSGEETDRSAPASSAAATAIAQRAHQTPDQATTVAPSDPAARSRGATLPSESRVREDRLRASDALSGSPLTVTTESVAVLPEYERIPIAFEVRRIFEVQSLASGPLLLERPVERAWHKDYDAVAGERPTRWALRFDLTRWGVITARRNGRLVGGAVLAWNTPGVDMLEGRKDRVVIWDLRVTPDERRSGTGTMLFRAAEDWAKSRQCTELEVETQNINLGACRFYARQGCVLRQVRRFAYPELPDEVQLIWHKDLSVS